MITSVTTGSDAQCEATKTYLAGLRDQRLKQAGLAESERLAFLARRIELVRSKSV